MHLPSCRVWGDARRLTLFQDVYTGYSAGGYIAQAVTGRLAELASGGAGDAGNGEIQFGDGETGARPPSGADETSTYRASIGEDGSGPDATRVHKGEQNGGSRIARPARSKVFWISMAA